MDLKESYATLSPKVMVLIFNISHIFNSVFRRDLPSLLKHTLPCLQLRHCLTARRLPPWRARLAGPGGTGAAGGALCSGPHALSH